MRLVTAALLLMASAGVANAIDCTEAGSNSDMKFCAAEDLKKADADLNVAYAKAIATAREFYQYTKTTPGNENMPDNEAMLRDAQRAWVSFRDANCKYQYQVYYGGSHAGLAYLLCMTDTTKARVKELRQLPGGEEFEN